MIPELVNTSMACELLGVKSPNLRDTLRRAGVPEPGEWYPGCRSLQLPNGPLWLAEDVRRVAEERALPQPPKQPRVCPIHGDMDMRDPPKAGRYCAVCNRERMRRKNAELRRQKAALAGT